MPYLTSWCINSPYDQAWQLKFTCMYINTLEGVREPRALQHSMQDKAERSFHALCCPGGNYFGDKEIFYSFPWRQARAQTQAEDLIIRSGGRMKGKKWVFKALLSLSFCDHRLFKRKLYCWMMETWWKGLSLFKYYMVWYYFGTTQMNSNVLTCGNATIGALDASI